MCDRSLTLRALVNERLTAAAEEIFALVERTIAEYEEELCRSKEENQRKQQLLDSVLVPQVRVARTEDGPENLCVKPEPRELSIEPEPHLPPAEILYFPVKVKDDTSETASEQQEPIGDENEEWTQPWEPSADAEEEECHDWNRSRVSNANQNADSFYKITKVSSQDECSVIVDEEVGMTELKTQLKKQNCMVCGKTLKSDLWSHMLVHTGERPFSCSVCNKGFTRRSSLTLHMGLHLSEKPFRCSICEKGFTQKSHLKLHMDSHTKQEQKRDESVTRKRKRTSKKAVMVEGNEKQDPGQAQSSAQRTGRENKKRKYREGSEQTESSFGLRPLAKTSFSERGDECPVCGKFFHDLWRHMLLHTGERPFRCKVCRKGFTRMSSLTLHKALHMNEKPFKCSICERGFTQNNNLKVHMAKHAKDEELLRQRQNPQAEDMLSVYLQQYLQSQHDFEPQPSTSAQ